MFSCLKLVGVVGRYIQKMVTESISSVEVFDKDIYKIIGFNVPTNKKLHTF